MASIPSVEAPCVGGTLLAALRRYCWSGIEGWRAKAPGQLLVPGFHFSGYDCGVMESSDNVHSVILHEVLFGKLPEMVQHATRLNSRLLFDEWQDAASLMAVRDGLSAHFGHALEKFSPDDDPGIVAVFELPRRPD